MIYLSQINSLLKMKTAKFLLILLLLILPAAGFSQNAKKYYRTGNEFVMAGNFKDAIEQFTKAIDLQPDFADAYVSRAYAYEKVQMLKQAADDYDRATTFLTKNSDVFYQCARLNYLLGEYMKAVEKADAAITLRKTNADGYVIKAKALMALGKYEAAMATCNTALTLKETAENFYLRGQINVQLGRFTAAEEDFIRTVGKDPRHVDAYISLAELRLQMNKIQFALNHVNNAISLDPNNRRAYLVRSRIYIKQLDYPRAIDDISKNIMMDPNDEEMYFIRGCYYQDFTQHTNAINDFTKVLMLNPKNVQALFKRAYSNEQIGNNKAAIKDYEALAALSETDEKAKELMKDIEGRLFELYRESDKPVIVIIEPQLRDETMLQFPKGSTIVTMKGVIEDESDIKSFVINNLQFPANKNEETGKYEFLAALDIQNKTEIVISATDVYDNTGSGRYVINLTEVGAPKVYIMAPYASDDGQIYLDSNNPSISIEGRIEDESLIRSILINGVLASYIPDELNPSFTANLDILNKNKITVIVSDVFGNRTDAEFTLNRDAANIAANNPMGKTWAVFIENSDYEIFASLEGPQKDVTLMKSALAKYQIHNIIHKKNMTKNDMERFFSIELRDLVRSNLVNSILIWYAGHGKFINETGYWIPVDAKRDDEFTYFNINALKASMQSYANYVTHVLVITDACESGPSFYQAMRSDPTVKSCDDWQATRFKSSQVFSSAGYQLAVDNSQFTKTFANSLVNNPNACIPIESIVAKVTTAVVKNNQQKPQFGKIAGLEDEDGTFFFMTK
jgi:tetratricopeptide (TPR) repeat protein